MKIIIGILILSISFLTLSCNSEQTNSEDFEIVNDDVFTDPNNPLGLLNDGNIEIVLTIFELAPLDYIKWMKNKSNNPLIKTKKIGKFNYTLTYLPIEYMICNELKKDEITLSEIDSLYPDYSGMEYYELKIQIDEFNDETAKYNAANMGEYQQRIAYMAFTMQNDLTATVDNKVVDCKLYHFERTYGVTPYATFLMGFSKEDIGERPSERTIIFEDNLFNKGLIKFNWSTNQLTNIPKIQVS